MPKVICPICHKPFRVRQGNYKFHPQCRPMARKQYYRKYRQGSKFHDICPICEKGKWLNSQMCRKCQLKQRFGENAYNWKGGRFIKDGYVYITVGKCHYKAEHRLVWEQTHNKTLLKGWLVHHLNGIRTDNRPQNLVALPNQKHCHLLEAKAKRIQELEAMLASQPQLI